MHDNQGHGKETTSNCALDFFPKQLLARLVQRDTSLPPCFLDKLHVSLTVPTAGLGLATCGS